MLIELLPPAQVEVADTEIGAVGNGESLFEGRKQLLIYVVENTGQSVAPKMVRIEPKLNILKGWTYARKVTDDTTIRGSHCLRTNVSSRTSTGVPSPAQGRRFMWGLMPKLRARRASLF